MANYFARTSGNINATNVWATTPSGTPSDVWATFNSGDVLHSNNFTITVNVSTTVGSIRNDNANGATAGGQFNLSAGVTITANGFAGTASAPTISFTGGSGTSGFVVGNLTGGSQSGANGATNNGAGTLFITGNCTGGALGNSHGASNNSTGILNITGNVIGGTINGAFGARNFTTGTTIITGNAIGGSGTGATGAVNESFGTTTIIGSAIASNNSVGASQSTTGLLSVIRAVGNDWGIGAVGLSSQVGVASTVVGSQTRVQEFEFGSLGQSPVSGAVSCPDVTTNVCLVHRLATTKKTLVDSAAVANYPAASNVRSGTSYNFGNTIGTLAVPSPSSVAFGVATDNTTGTAVLTPSDVWNALTSGMTTSGSIGERLKNAATVETTGQALADALSPVP